jgi:hypothetical protein
MTRPLRELEPGRSFKLPHTGKTGTLLLLGGSGARVRYNGSERKVKVESARTGQVAEFEAPGRAVIISDATEVEEL